jgi:hypothetical protein
MAAIPTVAFDECTSHGQKTSILFGSFIGKFQPMAWIFPVTAILLSCGRTTSPTVRNFLHGSTPYLFRKRKLFFRGAFRAVSAAA